MANQNDDNKMSREEAGRLGGEATSESHGSEFYEEIGSKGGQNSNSNSGGNNSSDGKMSKEEAGRKGGQNSNGGNS